MIFLHKRLYNPPSFGRFSQDTSLLFYQKQFALSVTEVVRNIFVWHVFTSSTVGEVYNISSNRESNFFWSEGEMQGLFCKSIIALPAHYDVVIYFKYCSPYPAWKLVKIWQKVDVSNSFCDGEHNFFFESKEKLKMPCGKTFLAN